VKAVVAVIGRDNQAVGVVLVVVVGDCRTAHHG
jgi:hypothetical protein